MADELKFCRDCKWVRPDIVTSPDRAWDRARCTHPSLVNLVSGVASGSCASQRIDYDHMPTCGRAGKNWEARDDG